MTKYVSSFQRQIFAQRRQRSNHSAFPVYNHFISACRGRKKAIYSIFSTYFLLCQSLDLIFQFSDLHLNYLQNGERFRQRGRGDDDMSVEVSPPVSLPWRTNRKLPCGGTAQENLQISPPGAKSRACVHVSVSELVSVWQGKDKETVPVSV